MSKFNPTKSQQLFIDSYGKNTLVSASAGSGKTSTMINKLADMVVNHGVELKKTLVVTYTNSAGNEIKQKLYNSLVDAMQNEQDNEKIEFIAQQLDDMVNCDIGTLHSVCKKIITTYFYVVEQDPTFSLLNEQQSAYLFNSSMMKVFNDLIAENNDDFYSIYRLFNKKRNLNQLMYIVSTLYNYLLSKVNADEWKQYVLNSCSVSNVSEKFLFEYFKNELKEYEICLKELKQDCLRQFDYYLDYVCDKLNFVLAVEKIDDFSRFVKFVDNYEFIKKPRVYSNKLSVDDIELVEKVDLVVSEFNEIIKSIKSNCVLMDEKDYEDYKILISKLFDVVDKVSDEYKMCKKLQNSLDFSDLEHITLEILKDEKIVKMLQDKYGYIFVDEYQDINQVQETIINKLKRENNLFMIGDVKQSIYAFRLSSPEIFIEKFNRYLIETDNNLLINLNENFRSEENILEFANLVFNKLITNKTIGIDYRANSQLVAGIKNVCKRCVSIDIIDKESGLSEGQIIANKVGQLIREGFNFKDIAILLRSKGELVSEIYSELKKYNIPCEATYKTDLFQNNEVLILYYLLKLLNNTNNDIAMATILKSLFVGLTDNELAEIRYINNDLTFYECVYEYLKNGTNEYIKEKLINFFNFLEEIRIFIDNNTIIDTINHIINRFNVINHYLSFVDGLEKVNNIKEFLRIVSNEEFKFDLLKCIDYLDNIKKDGSVTLTLSGEGDSVKIMTIHSSKGLEYPAVILGGMGKKFVLNKQTEDIIINDKLGIGIKLFDFKSRSQKESLIKNACKLYNKKNEIDEEIRLLYVALTRAKSRLCIVGEYDAKNVRYVANKNIYSSGNYFDLIVKSIPVEYLHFFENKVDNFIVNENNKNCFEVNFVKESNASEIDKKPIILNFQDNQLLNRLGKYFDYHYPYNVNNNIALKNSVSQILKEEQDYEKQVDSIVAENVLDDYSLKLGTAYHSVMQRLNFDENKANICEIINNVKSSDLPFKDVKVEKIMSAIEQVKRLIKDGSKLLKEAQFVMKSNYKDIVKDGADVDILIQGVVDLAIVTNDDAVIIDFKTNKTTSEKYLIDRYAMQLNMYAQAFEKAYNVKVSKKLLYSFEMGKFIEV